MHRIVNSFNLSLQLLEAGPQAMRQDGSYSQSYSSKASYPHAVVSVDYTPTHEVEAYQMVGSYMKTYVEKEA